MRIRRNKYNAKGVRIDDIYFPSTLEANRYKDLKLLAQAGEIDSLNIHPRYPIVIKDQHICFVVLDFSYHDQKTNQWIYEDSKGRDLSESKLRRKLFEVMYNRKVLVTGKAKR